MPHSELTVGSTDHRLARALTAGFSATGLMLGVFVMSYSALRALAPVLWDRTQGGLSEWVYNLVNNPLVNSAQGSFYLVMLGHLFVGLGFAVLYAYWAEPRLNGPGWKRGMLFALAPWVLSLVAFFPAVGAGFLGLNLQAGPLPILGNLVLHLFYGLSLGLVYGAIGDVLVERLDDPVAAGRERAALQESHRGAAVGILAGLVVGAVVGGLGASFGPPIGGSLLALPPGWVFATALLAGGALGGLVGSLASLPTSMSPSS